MSLVERDDADRIAVLETVLANHYDLFVALQSFDDLDPAGIAEAGLDGALFGLARRDDEDIRRAVGIEQRDARNGECIGAAFEHDADAREHARLQITLGVVDLEGHLERGGRGVDHRRDEFHRGREAAAGEGVDADGSELARLEAREFALGHEHTRLEWRRIGDAKHAGADRDFLAELDVSNGDDAGERRANRAVRQVELRDVVGGDLVVEIVLETFEGAGRHQSLVVQFDLALEIPLGLGARGARLRRLQPQLAIIELCEHLAGAHVIAFLHEHAAHFAAHLGDHFGVGLGFECGRAAVHREHFAAHGLGDFDGNGGFSLGLLVLLLGRLVAGDSVRGAGAEREGEHQNARAKKNVCHGPSPG